MKYTIFVSLITLILNHDSLNAGSSSQTPPPPVPATNIATQNVAPSPSGMPGGFADIIEKVNPAVVSIFSTQIIKERKGNGLGFPKGSPFEDFFKDFLDPRMQGDSNGKRERKATALGSGVIIDVKEGYVVTAAHVIADSEKITVTLSDNTELEAKVIGKDKRRDIALLKIPTDKPLSVASFGDSSKLRQGDWAIAIGNPHNLGNTVTVGVISSKARDLGAKSAGIETTQFIDDFIQTDAAVNQGNSGGPLFNIAGEVIGINVVILSDTGGSIGLGFAVPSNTVQAIIEQLKKYGHTREGRVGVEIQPVSKEIALSVGLLDNPDKPDQPKGAMVTRVFPDSPAAKGGIQVADIIIKVGEKDVKDVRSARKLISEAPIGTTTTVVVWRNNKAETLTLTTEEIPEADKDPVSIGTDLKDKTEGGVDVLGMKLQKLTDDIRKALKLDDKINGVVVVDVEKNTGDRELLRKGDVVIQIDFKAVTDPKEVEDKINEKKKQPNTNVLFQVHRVGQTMFVALDVGDKKPEDKKSEGKK